MMQKISQWFDKKVLDKKFINKNIYNWLCFANNLTNTIKDTGLNFSLNLLQQSFTQPYIEEIEAFANYKVDLLSSFVRKVFLEGDNNPIIFARVVIPEQTYFSYHDAFVKLGNSALGNTILYADKDIHRNKFEYKQILIGDPFFTELKMLQQIAPKDFYWARRSMFYLPKGPLLITEIFLDSLPLYPY